MQLHMYIDVYICSYTCIYRMHCTFVNLIDFGLGCSGSVPEMRVLKKTSNFFLDSTVMVPPKVHTRANKNRHCNHRVI